MLQPLSCPLFFQMPGIFTDAHETQAAMYALHGPMLHLWHLSGALVPPDRSRAAFYPNLAFHPPPRQNGAHCPGDANLHHKQKLRLFRPLNNTDCLQKVLAPHPTRRAVSGSPVFALNLFHDRFILGGRIQRIHEMPKSVDAATCSPYVLPPPLRFSSSCSSLGSY